MCTTTRIALGITTLVAVLGPAMAALADDEVVTATPVVEVVVPDHVVELTMLPTLEMPAPTMPLPEDPRPDPDFPGPHLVATPPLEFAAPADTGEAAVKPADVSGPGSGVTTPSDDDQGGRVQATDLSDLKLVSPHDDSDPGVDIQRVPADPHVPEWFEDMVDEAVADALSADAADQAVGPKKVEAASEAVAGKQERFGRFEPWMYGAFGAASVLIIWILLAVGDELARRRG